ncbi:MAG: hypothetical protein AAF633_22795 [Chloroflexota bacterium]
MFRTFAALCEYLPPERYANLAAEVERAVKKMRDAEIANQTVDLDAANKLAAVLNLLIREVKEDDQVALVVGAIRYFVLEYDAEPDTASTSGLDDDIQVVNAVVQALGRPELVIEL